ncbi:hypothetical protein JDV02_009018 [Purpureocillium takamizusanense]|uniref:Uncharacterized protein n=1 Tax=Purpureocillium takamizusanense TaxID=2060973 RepID=A0A9Q8QL96_9HYPO|nr:uncharacterized protein JDV02_009018 [Purpureocillium takamizusanense]UNI23184.1 hypothetical protein JDV02_009018 [Purpureocillium takamizusanense]
MATGEATTIAGAAELALSDFQRCLHLSAQLHPRESALVEDQLARFSLWMSEIGVFARERASVDHRLREAPDVRDAVIGLLETLADSVQNCSLTLQSILDSRKETAESLSIAEARVSSSVRAIAGEIHLLYRLSNTIRRAGRESQNIRC